MADQLASRSENFSEWYNQIVQRADLADYGAAKGTMIIKPYGYALWENIQAFLDKRFKAHGAKNAFFPTFIPLSFIQKEKEHVEGFTPNLWLVTVGGGEPLEEPYAVRPTSETALNSAVGNWIHSYRDLPLLLNLWNSCFRYELRTRLFLRTSEFLWQEGHTFHATWEEADRYALDILNDAYLDFYINAAAIPVIAGRKTEREKFAGADITYTLEALMGDGRALQSCTSHNLGHNFAKSFDIRYLDRNNELQYVASTSWGFSTRAIGSILMTHGDDKGLLMPPRLAPTQMVIVPIFRKEDEQARVMEMANRIKRDLDDYRVELDAREGLTPGFKYNDWEMRGVPIRIEIGPKDVEKNQVVLVRRDTGEKKFVPIERLLPEVKQMLDQIHDTLYARAKKFQDDNTFVVETYEEFQERTAGEGGAGFLMAHWCGDSQCEAEIQQETKATIRCIPFDQTKEKGKCLRC
ncbi:MAG TPA: proline--tRNA ligase, partial [Anaerolineae bacterium]|nr:proline--tRNA ligase [Anaerolineae bacterium]